MRLLWKSQAGTSLIELLVGGAIALLAIGAIIQLQITAYRSQHADESLFLAQSEAMNGLDRIVRDIRMASSISVAGSSVALHVDGAVVQYHLDTGTGQVIRTENGVDQALGGQVESLRFTEEGGGRTVRVEWLARLADGSTYLLESRASPRIQ